MNQFLAKLRKGKVERIGFKAQAQGGELELQVYDVIGADFFGEGITVANFSQAMKDAGEYSTITVRLNSPGGDVFEAVAIYNLLRNSGKPVKCVVDGVAASAASVIAMAGDKCTMGEGSMMMIHNAMMMAFGNADEMRKCADTLDTVSGSIADIYTANTGLDKADVQNMMDAETWMDANECVEKGFADEVTSDQVQARATAAFDLALYNNVPDALKVINREGHTKRVDGENLGPEDFLYVGDREKNDTWSLPWHFSTEEKTVSHLRDALARFDQDEVIPEDKKAEVHAHLVQLCKEHGIEVSKDDKGPKAESPVHIELMRKRLELLRRA